MIEGSWMYLGDVSISEGANNPPSGHYLASPENIAIMTETADIILRYSESPFEAAVFLSIAMRETYLGVLDKQNPMQLSNSSGIKRENKYDRIENIRLAMQVFRRNFQKTGDVHKALIAYNGNTKVDNGRAIKYWYGDDVYRGYLDFLNNMVIVSYCGVPWRLGW